MEGTEGTEATVETIGRVEMVCSDVRTCHICQWKDTLGNTFKLERYLVVKDKLNVRIAHVRTDSQSSVPATGVEEPELLHALGVAPIVERRVEATHAVCHTQYVQARTRESVRTRDTGVSTARISAPP